MQAVSKATGNVSGLVNQVVNTFYRVQEGDQLKNLQIAIDTNNVNSAAT